MNKPKVILDSGAYTAFRKGIVIDIDEYGEFIKKQSNVFVHAFNLDAIGDGKKSYKNWKYLREKGIDTIPVYHLGTDEKWLQKYLKQSDHVALGAIANLSSKKRILGLDMIWKKYLLDSNDMPHVKVHGLGLTAIPIMLRYPWYSVDSFTPVISAIWGGLLLPKYSHKLKRFDYLDLAIYKISNQGNHKQGTMNSFLSQPEIYKKACIDLFKENGFELGTLFYQEKNLRRGEKEKQNHPELFSLNKEIEGDEISIANKWEERTRWNLMIWNKLKERLPNYPRKMNAPLEKFGDVIKGEKTIMYMGISTETILGEFNKTKPKHDILISYAYLKGKIFNQIKDYIK